MNRSRIGHHLLFWIVYLAFKTYHEFVWLYPSYPDLPMVESLWTALKVQSLLLPVKVLFTYWLLRAIAKESARSDQSLVFWLRLVLALALAVVLFRLQAVYVVLPLGYAALPESQPLFPLGGLSSAIIDILLVAGLATVISLYRRQNKERRRAEQFQREKLTAELYFLRQQTNPHFLFNTLNNLYGLARRNDPRTAESILRLSQLLRFMLYETQGARIPLQREVKWIKDYLALESLRYGERLRMEVRIDPIPPKTLIAPLLLIPLLENACKHGASKRPEAGVLSLRIQLNEEQMKVLICNHTDAQVIQPDGIGLSNLRRQLVVQYPDHRLFFRLRSGTFTVLLVLNLANYATLLLPDS